MKLGKAAGLDGIEVEHLLYAHPLLIVMLCVLFNIMLIHGVVPRMFGNSVIVPITKNKKMVSLLLWTITEGLLSVLHYLNCLRLEHCPYMKTVFVYDHYSLDSSKKWDVVMLLFFLDL